MVCAFGLRSARSINILSRYNEQCSLNVQFEIAIVFSESGQLRQETVSVLAFKIIPKGRIPFRAIGTPQVYDSARHVSAT